MDESGQKINHSKSALYFSKNISETDMEVISLEMGIPIGVGRGKYLGLPFMTWRSKKDIFRHVEEKVRKKMSGWKERFLSPGGKEVLIKSVIQAIPSYVMQCFALPQNLISSLQKMVRKFFWSSGDGQQKLHLRSWEVCCRTKKKGGIGFRNLAMFNKALLAKQVWRLVQCPDSLVGLLLRAKYHPHSDIMNAPLGSRRSFLWRSLLEGRELLARGLRWRVSNGSSIQVYKDPSLLIEPTYKPAFGLHSLSQDSTVHDLFIPGTRTWDITRIQQHFLQHEAECIINLPLPSSRHHDKRIWHFHRKGIYTVKSGYHIAATLKDQEVNGHSSSTSSSDSQWGYIWQLPVQPKIAHFVWRVAQNCLPTADNLRRRGIAEGVCGICGTIAETVKHCLLDCYIPQGVSQRIEWFGRWNTRRCASFNDLMLTIIEREGKQEAGYYATLLWLIWKARCAAIFEGAPVVIERLCTTAQTIFEDYLMAAHTQQGLKSQLAATTKWRPPLKGFVKCNVDGSLRKGRAGIGAIFRDQQGNILACFYDGLTGQHTHGNTEMIELLAMKAGLEEAFNLGFSCVEMETDCAAIIQRIRGEEEDYSVMGAIVADLLALSSCFYKVLFSFIKRAGNVPAHLLAQHGLSVSSRYVYVQDLPNNVLAASAADL